MEYIIGIKVQNIDSKFEDLIKIRRELVDAKKKNNEKSSEIIASLYTKSEHFIYELLQNTEDTGAKSLEFKIFKDRLKLIHNGRAFNYRDIESITNIGDSSKKDINAIGKFGIGFKSVYKITQTPQITSGEFNFRILDYLVPEPLENKGVDPLKTTINLPFESLEQSVEEIHKMVSTKLLEIKLENLLFLKNIQEIVINNNGIPTIYSRHSNIIKSLNGITVTNSKLTAEGYNLLESKNEEYLIFSKNVPIGEKNFKVEIAYKLDNGNISTVKTSKVFVFFETEHDTNLNFLINGPYQTNKARENVPDNEINNIKLLEGTAELVSESIFIIKEMGLLTVAFLSSVLPITSPADYDKGFIYNRIFNEVKKILTSNIHNLLPTSDDNFSNPENLLLAESKEFFSDFLSSIQLKQLFDKGYWLPFNITDGNMNKNLFYYLKNELSIESVSSRNFAEKLSKEFLEAQSEEWIILLYNKFNDVSSLWKVTYVMQAKGAVARRKPIIRLEDGSHIEPFDFQGKPQVYLPTEGGSKYKIVKKSIYDNLGAQEFLKSLGLPEPDIYVELREDIFPKYKNQAKSFSLDEIKQDFIKIMDCYNKFSLDYQKKYALTSEIISLNFLLSKNENGKYSRNLAQDLYYPQNNLLKYFENYEKVKFIDLYFYIEFIPQDLLDKFFKDIRINTLPKKICFNRNLEEEDLKLISSHDPNFSKYTNPSNDYELEGLQNILNLENLDEEKSLILWEIICEYSSKNVTIFSIDLEYFKKHGKKGILFPIKSKLIKMLIDNPWVLNKEKVFCKPSEITLNELSDIYGRNFHSLKLIEALNFKPEISMENFPESLKEEMEMGKLFKEYMIQGLSKDKILKALNKELINEQQIIEQNSEKIEILQPNNHDLLLNVREPITKITEEISENFNNFEEDENFNEREENSELDISPDLFENNHEKNEDSISTEPPLFRLSETKNTNETNILQNPKDNLKRLETKKQKLENQIASEAKIAELRKEISELENDLRKYTFLWFKKVLRLEYELSIKNSISKDREIKIYFSKMENPSENFIILKNPSRPIPYYIEDLSDIPLKIIAKSHSQPLTTFIDVVNVKDNSLKAKLQKDFKLDGLNSKDFISAQIDVKNILFILEQLIQEFEELNFNDDEDIKELLPDGLEFVFGPPGTGKTTHIASEIKKFMDESTNLNILVLTPTNKAADVLARKIILKEDNYVPSWLIRFGNTGDSYLEELNITREKTYDINKNPKNVVISTIARFPYDQFQSVSLRDFKWDIVLFDEASMIGLASILYTIYKQKEHCKKFIVAGDPFQIPPITYADEWKDENIYTLVELDNFEDKFTNHKKYPVLCLTKQYRSIPSIGTLFSNYSYHGLLTHNRKQDDKKELIFKNKKLNDVTVIEFPVEKFNSLYKSQKLDGGSSYQIYSAIFTLELVLELKREIEKKWQEKKHINDDIQLDEFNLEELNKSKWTIGIICPYKAQSLIINRMLSDLLEIDSKVSIITDTVHGFQGDECDIIICVLNPPPTISTNVFLNNKKILNVAISRARDYLIMIIPDRKTSNFEQLIETNKILEIISTDLKDSFYNTKSWKMEKLLFDNSKFISENTFITSHQKVNVYSNHNHRYEFRTREGSIDGDAVDIHLDISNM